MSKGYKSRLLTVNIEVRCVHECQLFAVHERLALGLRVPFVVSSLLLTAEKKTSRSCSMEQLGKALGFSGKVKVSQSISAFFPQDVDSVFRQDPGR